MDDKQLAEIEARTWAATQGPWRWHWRRDDSHWPGSIFAEPRTGHAYAVAMCPRYGKESFEADAEFIAHARQDIPDLIAELRKAWEEIEIMCRERRQDDEDHAALEAEDRKWRSGP